MPVLTKDHGEGTVYLAEVARLHLDKVRLVPAYGQEQCVVAGIADFHSICADDPTGFLKGRRRAAGVSVSAHEPIRQLREIRWWLDWLNHGRGIVVVEKRSLEADMLFGKCPGLHAVV